MTDLRDPGATPVVRSGPDERAYMLRRAAEHRDLAERTQEAETRMVHLRLCALYEGRAARIDA